MRRIVLSLAVLAASALGACGGTGTVLSLDNNTSIDRTVVTVVGASNVARVLPGATIAISAVPVRGSANGTVLANQFTWSAQLVPSGQYPINALGQTKACGSLNFVPTGSPAGTVGTPMTQDYTIYLTIDPTNEANVLFTPPTLPVAPPGGAVNIIYPYCVVVSATPKTGNGSNGGSITVAVVNPSAPEQ